MDANDLYDALPETFSLGMVTQRMNKAGVRHPRRRAEMGLELLLENDRVEKIPQSHGFTTRYRKIE